MLCKGNLKALICACCVACVYNTDSMAEFFRSLTLAYFGGKVCTQPRVATGYKDADDDPVGDVTQHRPCVAEDASRGWKWCRTWT